MIYVCNHCDREMIELTTPGDEVNNNLICTTCAQSLTILLEKAREIQHLLLTHFKDIL